MKFVLTGLMVVAGMNHFLNPGFYLRIMPALIPFHLEIVYLTGLLEVALGLGLLVPASRLGISRLSAWGLIVLFILIFPANVNMALKPDLAPGVAPILLWLRLPLQGVLIAWAWVYTR
jgi:uncharacterized membrane protein